MVKPCKICNKDVVSKKYASAVFCDECKANGKFKEYNSKKMENLTNAMTLNKTKMVIKKCKICEKDVLSKFYAGLVFCDECKKNVELMKCFFKTRNEKIIDTCLSSSNRLVNVFKFTKPHRILKQALNEIIPENKFETEQCEKINKKSYSIDELDRVNKIALFVDGDYWHKNPEKYDIYYTDKLRYFKSVPKTWWKDAVITQNIQLGGYKVIRVWENDIKKNVDECVEKIKLVLDNKQQMSIEEMIEKIKKTSGAIQWM